MFFYGRNISWPKNLSQLDSQETFYMDNRAALFKPTAWIWSSRPRKNNASAIFNSDPYPSFLESYSTKSQPEGTETNSWRQPPSKPEGRPESILPD